MKLKKWICIALIAVFILALSGCALGNLTGVENKSQRYSKYIEATMDCTFFNDHDEYLERVNATEDEAEEIYQSTVEWYADLIMYQCEVVAECLSEETVNAFNSKAASIIEKASYTVAPASRNSDGDYTVTVTIQPIDFLTVIDCQEAIDWYNTTYADTDFDAMTDEEYAAIEEHYAKKVLAILDDYTVGYLDEVKCTVTILEDSESYSVSDADWSTLDEKVLGIVY